jgi:hypothetical protein
MANTIQVVQQIAKEMLRVLHNQSPFIGNCNQNYDKDYDSAGAQIGSQLKIRLPNKYTVGTSRVVTPQTTEEDTVTITRATQKNVAVEFTSEELTQHIDESGVKERVIRPAMAQLASAIAADCYTKVKKVYNRVGTPGTTPASMLTVLNAGRKLDENLASPIDRTLIVNPAAQVAMVNALSGLYNAAPAVSKQYMTGQMKNCLGFDWYSDALIPVLTTGSDHTTVTVNGAAQAGSSLITAGGVMAVGDSFTIADVYAVHPETKTAYDYLQQFTVLSTADNLTYVISPSIITSGAKQNVSAVPADTAVITVAGTASTNYPMNIAFTKNAFAFVGAKMKTYKDAQICVQESFEGLSLRLWSASDVTNDVLITRIDALYGFECIRPEEACVVWG